MTSNPSAGSLAHSAIWPSSSTSAGALKEGDQHLSRFAADVARTAAPDDEISLLDNIAIQAVDGHIELARRRTIEEIHGRIDDEFAPTEPPERTQEIIERRGLNCERRREPRTGSG